MRHNTPAPLTDTPGAKSLTTKTLTQGAAILGCTERWYADQIRAGRFPARKVAGRWRVTDGDIAAALEMCRNYGQPATLDRIRAERERNGLPPIGTSMTGTTRRRMRNIA
jgi:hypothetical protein